MTPYRVLITGSRDWTDREAIIQPLWDIYVSIGLRPLIIVHGACKTGADWIASNWVQFIAGSTLRDACQIDEEPHPANWDRSGRAAGPIRNQQMVDAGADLCLAFPLNTSRGTSDCIRRAREARIPTLIFHDTPGDTNG